MGRRNDLNTARSTLVRHRNAILSFTVALLGAPVPASSQTFDSVFQEVARGPIYSDHVPTGLVDRTRSADAGEFPYFIQVPLGYTAERRYPVRVFLHGGVSRPPWDASGRGWWRLPERVASDDYIGIFPAAWNEQRWWQESQLQNLREILIAVRQTYNVDENRVSLLGVSDGGTGVYFAAFRDTTPWASFLPFIAHAAVLLNPASGATGEIYRTNLTNKPLFIVNGEDDRLYPTRVVDPYVSDFSAGGVEMVYRPLEGVGHVIGWWPQEAQNIDEFIAARPREAHPTCISWEAEVSTGTGARAHWLRLDTFGTTALDEAFVASPLLDGGVPSGRVDAQRLGNTIRLRSSGVLGVTLLVSPDAFDVDESVQVWWNGVLVHEGAVDPSVDVLQRWAARDRDRTMLYAAEISLPAPTSGEQNAEHFPASPGSGQCRGL